MCRLFVGGNTINPRRLLSCPSCASCMAGCCVASYRADTSCPLAPLPLANRPCHLLPFSSGSHHPARLRNTGIMCLWTNVGRRGACEEGGLSTRPPPSFSSLSLATFDCCVVVIVVVVVRCPSSGCHHLLLFVGAASAIILQQTTLTSSLSPSLPTPFRMADCCVGVGLMGRA